MVERAEPGRFLFVPRAADLWYGQPIDVRDAAKFALLRRPYYSSAAHYRRLAAVQIHAPAALRRRFSPAPPPAAAAELRCS